MQQKGASAGADWAYPYVVIAIIAIPHVTGQLFVIFPWFEFQVQTVWQLLWLVVFNGLVGMVYWNYFLACTTDPGYYDAPSGKEDGDAEEVISGDAALSRQQASRWCHKCQGYKPPRAHHCSACKRYLAFFVLIF
jgi:hypothetical protein